MFAKRHKRAIIPPDTVRPSPGGRHADLPKNRGPSTNWARMHEYARPRDTSHKPEARAAARCERPRRRTPGHKPKRSDLSRPDSASSSAACRGSVHLPKNRGPSTNWARMHEYARPRDTSRKPEARAAARWQTPGPTGAIPARFLLLLGVAALLVGAVLTACGPTPPPPPPEPITLQLQWVTQAQFAGYYVALDKGWYAEEGIDLTIEPGGPDLIPVDLLSSGAVDFATALLPDLAVAVQEGKPLISISQIQQNNGLLLLSFKSSGIETPQDFRGKRVGVWLGGWDAQFRALIAEAGLTTEDFELVPQGFSMDPFLEGDLDVASAMIYNEYHVVLEHGISPDELNIIDYADYGLDFPGDTLCTRRETCEQNPDLCVRMLRASLRGWQYAVDHPEEAAALVLKYDKSGVQTREHQIAMMNDIAKLVSVPLRPLGFTERDDVRRTLDTLVTYDVLDRLVQPEDVFTNAIWEQARQGGQ